MATFTFDVKLFATVSVDADSEETARKMVAESTDCVALYKWDDTTLGEASMDGEPDLIEIDGEPV